MPEAAVTGGHVVTPMISPYLTRPGSFLPLDLRPHSIRAFSSVAQSTARNGILFALRIVSSLDVAVMIWEDPAVREVNRYKVGSVE